MVGGSWAWAGTAGSISAANVVATYSFVAPLTPFPGGWSRGASGEVDQMGWGGVVY